MVDKQKVEQAIRLLLEGIGEDITREGLIDTPDRIARMCEEIYGGLLGLSSEELAPSESLPSASEEEDVAPALWLSDAFFDVEP